MAGISRNRRDVGAHSHIFSGNFDGLYSFLDETARSPYRLISYKQKRVVWVRQILPLVMHDSSAVRHPTAGDDDLGTRNFVYFSRLIGMQSRVKAGKVKEVLVFGHSLLSRIVEIFLVLLEYFRKS